MNIRPRKKETFWMVLLLTAVPLFTMAGLSFYAGSIVGQFEYTAFMHTFEEAAKNTQVFLDTVEFQKEWEEHAVLMNIVKYRVTRYDEEHAINCLLLDADFNLVSERVVKSPFCDPFTMPVDSSPMFTALSSGQARGNFSLSCTGADGKQTICHWYYQTLSLNDGTYYVLTGVQPSAVSQLLDTGRLYIAIFAIGLVLIACANTTIYVLMKNKRSRNARTRRTDLAG